MNYTGIPTLEVLEGANNYNKWIADSIKNYIHSPVLEIGAGNGNISKYFLAKKSLYLSDVDSRLLKDLEKKCKKNTSVHFINLDITKPVVEKYKSFFTTIYGINVLEHVNDDLKAIGNMSSLLKRGGRLILLVPAKKNAYTRLDKILGHFRRYEKNELKGKIEKKGFFVEKIYYFNFIGLFSWIIRDKFEGNNVHLKPYQIAAFDIIVPVLKFIESRISIPIGISLVVIARKL